MEYKRYQRIGLFAGVGLFALALAFPRPEGMAPEAQRVAAVTLLMGVWWMTEAIPIPATALLPIVLFPLLKIMPSGQTTLQYANHLVFLYVGGFFLALTMERWNLHRRIALYTIRMVGARPASLILGFMLATAFLSMWVSNTATTLMMVPIGVAVIQSLEPRVQGGRDAGMGIAGFGTALMLSIAYAASIGGVATIIGTPTNTVVVGVIERLYDIQIPFMQWMTFAFPLSVCMLLIAWRLLTHHLFPVHRLNVKDPTEVIEAEIRKLGAMSREERKVLCVWSLVVLGWCGRGFIAWEPLSMIHDTTIAVGGAVLLFLIPVNWKEGKFLLDWQTAVKIPWDIVLLFGGGFALAGGIKESGLAEWIGNRLTLLQGVSMIVVIFSVVTLTIFLTELTSNVATTTMLAPIMGALAEAMQVHPFGLIIAAGVAASYAFMLPVATPPNAVVFSSGRITIPQMARAGIWLNVIGILLITGVIYFVMPLFLGIDLARWPF